MLSTVINSVQEAESNESDSCINYINHEEQSIFNSSIGMRYEQRLCTHVV